MERSTASGKNGKYVIIVFTYTCRVLKEMLPYRGEEVSASRLLIGLKERANVVRS